MRFPPPGRASAPRCKETVISETQAASPRAAAANGAPTGNTERRQRVVDEIKRRIVTGELRPGQRIVEAELTSALGVSRPTAREALNQLSRDGYLVQEAYRGHRMAHLEAESLLEIARVRVALDTEAITEIVRDPSGEGMRLLERSWEEFEEASRSEDPLLVHEAHLRFHRGIWEAAGNYLLMRIWPVVEAQMTIVLAYDQFARRDSVRAHAVHQGLMRAIRSGEDAQIREALEIHTIDSARGLAFLLGAETGPGAH
ncbi:GntR family transcriptional regulator [Brevibacterium album]|uniref:GntR family transcriptional regulator n=1 Tax=Brevibacterium album TaxID=417948 RepID=UPI00041FD2CB|nr:GntR family transcriptional regulator [Brevibacterium album]